MPNISDFPDLPNWAVWVLDALLLACVTVAGWLVRKVNQNERELHALRANTASRGDFTTLRSEILTVLNRMEDKIDSRLTAVEKEQADLRVDVAVVEQVTKRG